MKYEIDTQKGIKKNHIDIEFGMDQFNSALQTRVIAFLELLMSVQDIQYTIEGKMNDDDAIVEKTRQAAIEHEKQARAKVYAEAEQAQNVDEVPQEPTEQTVIKYGYTDTVEQPLPPLEDPQQTIEEPEVEEDI